jgi:hypothetical protein
MGQSPFSLILANTSLEKRVQNKKKKRKTHQSSSSSIYYTIQVFDYWKLPCIISRAISL